MASVKSTKVASTRSTMTLSMRLLRGDRTIDQAIRDSSEATEVASSSGRLFTAQSPGTPPGWLNVINHFTADGDLKLENKNCGAILFLEITPDGDGGKMQTFALAFGGGHRALDPDAFVRNFR